MSYRMACYNIEDVDVMNELMVVLVGGSYFYYKTESMDVAEATEKFIEALESVGINTDNITIERCELRDCYGCRVD